MKSLSYQVFTNNSTTTMNSADNRLIDLIAVKIIFAFIMALLCLATTVGNICVICLYKNTQFVSICFIFYSLGASYETSLDISLSLSLGISNKTLILKN